MKIVGSIQARMGSTRLPGKVLKEICGKPMLLWHVERIRRARLLDDLVIATTTNPDDDEIVQLCKNHNLKYFRGSEEDVLNRIACLIKKHNIDVHVEFFGDSPLSDAHVIDEVIGFYLKYQDVYDYVSNSLKTTYPPGQEVSVYKGTALSEADTSVHRDDPLREHVSIHVTKNQDKFKVYNLEAPKHYHYPEIYMEVDTPQDFELLSKIVDHFVKKGQEYFSLAQILDYLLKKPELIEINQNVNRRWKKYREDNV